MLDKSLEVGHGKYLGHFPLTKNLIVLPWTKHVKNTIADKVLKMLFIILMGSEKKIISFLSLRINERTDLALLRETAPGTRDPHL